MKYLYSLLFALIGFHALAQKIKIVDQSTLQSISDARIYTVTIQTLTNNLGEANITAFKGSDSIYIHHPNYFPVVLSYKELANMNFIIMLSEKIYSLDEIVISASKFEEKRKDIAQNIQVIKEKELAFISQQTTADVMQNSGNILVQKSQAGGGSPIIRGFETNKVLIVVDGVRMNNAIYRGGHLQNIITLDNSMLEKVEIVFGPGSVMYGSDALGGVMHFYSKNPMLADTGLTTKTNAYVRYATVNQENTAHVDFSIGGKKFASLSSFTYSKFDDLRQGNIRNPFYGGLGARNFYVVKNSANKDSAVVNADPNLQVGSGYTQYDVLQKFLYKQNEKVSHVLNLQFSTSTDIPRYDRLTQVSGGNPKFGDWYYGPQQRLLSSYALKLSKGSSFYNNARVIVAYQNIEESRNDRRFQKNILNHRLEQLDIVSLNADFDKKINKNEFRYGIEAVYNKVNSSAFAEDITTGSTSTLDTRYPDGGSTMQSLAAYFTHTFEVSKKFIINDGIRLNNVRLNSQFNDTTFFPFPFNSVTQNNTAVNGNLGLISMPGKGWRFTLVGATGFRAPNVDDLSKVFESVTGKVVVPNPELKPEYTYNLDLGILKSFNEKITIGANGFYTIYDNAITTRPGKFNGADSVIYDGQMSAVTMNTNANEAYIYGANAYLNADVTSRFSIVSTLNYTFGRIKTDSTDYPLDHIPPVFGKTSFNLKVKKFRGEFFMMYSGWKQLSDYNMLGEDNFADNATSKGMPAWVTFNVRAAYQFNKHTQLQVAVENILDTNYRVFASNISAPGRNLAITLRGNF
ncbi:MAG: TonB-dependent receptor [Bacteroidetes bacterium]|nr:TonB-dependent receptor [Bacteroidota bacterium]